MPYPSGSCDATFSRFSALKCLSIALRCSGGNDVVDDAALAVHADANVMRVERAVEGSLVNWPPWSVLKTSGAP
jgi:hypothetical protein